MRLEGAQAHYLATVMRAKAGAPVRLLDDATGEWLAEIIQTERRAVTLAVRHRLAPRATPADLWLLAAPIKAARWDWLVEKATELGIARLVPVTTQRTIIDKVKPERIRAQMVEAAEQSGRTSLPDLAPATSLTALLADWPAERVLLWADEQGGVPLGPTVAAAPGPAALLVGPEGGFTDQERALLAAHSHTRAVTLGPTILRAETAALAGIAMWLGATAA